MLKTMMSVVCKACRLRTDEEDKVGNNGTFIRLQIDHVNNNDINFTLTHSPTNESCSVVLVAGKRAFAFCFEVNDDNIDNYTLTISH